MCRPEGKATPLEPKFEYIDDLDPTSPLGSEAISQGDEHLRGIKSVLTNQFPSLGAGLVQATAAELTAAGKYRRAVGGIYDYAGNQSISLPANNAWVKVPNSGFTGYTDDAGLIVASPGVGDVAIQSGWTPERVNLSAILNLRMEGNPNVGSLDQTRAEMYRNSNSQRVDGSPCVAPLPSQNETILLAISCVDTAPAASGEAYSLRLNHSWTGSLSYLIVSIHWYADVLGAAP